MARTATRLDAGAPACYESWYEMGLGDVLGLQFESYAPARFFFVMLTGPPRLHPRRVFLGLRLIDCVL
jgi:hypothetical protein